MANPKKFLPLRLTPELIAEIDAVVPPRGRTKFVEAALREKLDRLPGEQRQMARDEVNADTGVVIPIVPGVAIGGTVVHFPGTTVLTQGSIPGPLPPTSFNQNVGTCAHVVLGIPYAKNGLHFRDCRGCGQAQLQDS